jgi:CBS domain containing-hemolysin-like protein
VLLETLSGAKHAALARFHAREAQMRARWAILQASCLLGGVLLLRAGEWSWFLTFGVVLGLYAVSSQAVAALLRATAERSIPTVLALVRPLDTIVALFADPFVKIFNRLVTPLEADKDPADTGSQVEMLVNEGELSGALGREQSEMIRNVLDFGDTEAGELMVPRPHVTAVDVDSSTAELLDLIHENEHSRYPVYRERIDNVIGILHVKDIFLFTSKNPGMPLPLRDLLRPPVFIPETQLAESVLRQMRAGRHHMAIVIDEYGGMSGLLTLEDLVEEIVGEIRDEYDTDEQPIIKLSNGHLVVDASVPIAELNRHAGIELPDGEDYNSLGGFIIEVMGRVPEAGAVLESLGHRFVIRTADERHISKVEIVPANLARA